MRESTKQPLIVASLIIIVLVIIWFILSQFSFSLGGSPNLGYGCNAFPDYYCTNLTYSHSTGNLSLSFEQNTGAKWSGWAIGYASNTTITNASGVPSALFVSFPEEVALPSAQVFKVTSLPASASNISLLTETLGSVWVCFSSENNVTGMTGEMGKCIPKGNPYGKVNYIRIATLKVLAS